MQGTVQPLNEKGLYPIALVLEDAACGSCMAKGICQIPASERIEVSPEQLPPGVRAGDAVDVELPAGFRVRLAFSIFVLPLLLMVAGAALGASRGERWSIVSGFAGLLTGVLLGWLASRGPAAERRIRITRC